MWSELESLLSAYLEERASRRELGLWLAEFDWDSADPEDVVLQDDVAMLDLIVTEVAEGLRPESELREIAGGLLSIERPSCDIDKCQIQIGTPRVRRSP
jgi:hypothetical protein